MKKVLLLVLLVTLGKNVYAESQIRTYGIVGSGYSAVASYGGGLSYSWNSTPKEDKKLLHFVDVNSLFLGIQDIEHQKHFNISDPSFQFNFFVTYGLGFKTQNDVLLSFDILGMGINTTARANDFAGDPGGSTYTKIGVLFNTLGVQAVFPSGMYLAWRNTYTGYNWRSTEIYRETTEIADAGEFKTMLMFGYAFKIK